MCTKGLRRLHRALLVPLLASLFVAHVAHAVVVRDLYVAAVPIAQRTGEPPPEAVSAALSAVLVKLAGRRDIASDPGAADLIAAAQSYVQQTGYTEQGQLRVGFEPDALRRDMLARGLPVWGDDRPSVLVWLAIDLAGSRSIVGSDDETGVREALVTLARERGLPLQLPLLDAEDLGRLQFGDIWGGFDESLFDATERYGADAMLIGRARGDTLDQLSLEWRLVQGENVEDWPGTLFDGVEHAADILAGRYATVSAGGDQRLRVFVNGVPNGQAYTRVLHYLESLTLVSDVAVERVSGSRVEFTLRTMVEADKLGRQLELSGFLVGDDSGSLAYTYRP
jgi:hypothetical protein